MGLGDKKMNGWRCAFVGAVVLLTLSGQAWSGQAPLRILHVMSYHDSWAWNREQFDGFKAGLKGVNASYRVVELDTKRNSDDSAIREKVEKAREIIDSWKPHLLYTNDDNAQKYLAEDLVGSELPIVFSGVNRDPSEYGFVGSPNVTGVLEHEHFIPTVHLLRRFAPQIRRIAVIVDTDPTWRGVMSRLRSGLRDLPNLEITEWVVVGDLETYQRKVLELQDRTDALALLGVFNLKDESGRDVDYETVLRWTNRHSRLPDFAFWRSRVERGTLCAVAVSGYEQGLAAGRMARRILVDGVSPASIEMRPTSTGEPMINLSRARQLDLIPPVDVLLSVTTIKDYAWER